MLGCVAAVTAMVSPSQPSPAVIHKTSISEMGKASVPVIPFLDAMDVIFPWLSNAGIHTARLGRLPAADSTQFLRFPLWIRQATIACGL